jgi:hypothetical protein
MVEDAPEGGLNVIAVLEDILVRISNASAPELAEMTSESVLIKHRRTFIRVVSARRWNRSIDGAGRIGSIGAIHADATFPFAHRPLQGGEDEPRNEIYKETREVNVE